VGAKIIVDGLFGDSGKGKIGAYLARKEAPDYSVAAGTGPSANHRVVLPDGRAIETRQIPPGWISPRTLLRIGAHALVDLEVLQREALELAEWNAAERLVVDRRCGIVEQRHVSHERSAWRFGDAIPYEAGTTAARAEYVWREARRIADVEPGQVRSGDVTNELNTAAANGSSILVHGDHGTLLSLYLGIDYPYTTSADCTATAAAMQIGLAWRFIDEVIMVVKALPTRSGRGSLPHELALEDVEQRGLVSYGRISGSRLRVSGAIDRDLFMYACSVNQPTSVALGCADLADERIRGSSQRSQITPAIRRLVEKLEDWSSVPVAYISTGPGIDDVIDLA
jgi:adenylosuccinate synthase